MSSGRAWWDEGKDGDGRKGVIMFGKVLMSDRKAITDGV